MKLPPPLKKATVGTVKEMPFQTGAGDSRGQGRYAGRGVLLELEVLVALAGEREEKMHLWDVARDGICQGWEALAEHVSEGDKKKNQTGTGNSHP
jgi:hypothetical protein